MSSKNNRKIRKLRDQFTKDSILSVNIDPKDSEAHSCEYRHRDGVGFKIFCKDNVVPSTIKETWKLHKTLYRKYPDLFPKPLRLGKMEYCRRGVWNPKLEAFEDRVTTCYYIAMEHIEGDNLADMVKQYSNKQDCWSVIDPYYEAMHICEQSDHPFFKEYTYSDIHGYNIRILPNHDSFKIIDIDSYRIHEAVPEKEAA